MQYDIIVIGSGPGGYVAAVRAAQYGFNVAVVEKAEIGGICLNWGCIPTKALLKSAETFQAFKHLASYGISFDGDNIADPERTKDLKADVAKIVERERGVADKMRKGVEFLFKKNKITVVNGKATITGEHTVSVDGPEGNCTLEGKYIIIATGAHPKALPFAPFDGEKVISYRHALVPKSLPKSLAVIGSGAIGSELADFYLAMGCEVHLIEFLDRIVPLEDDDVSAQLSRSFRKEGMKVMVSTKVCGIEIDKDAKLEDGTPDPENVTVTVESKKGEEKIKVERVLCAVGVAPNTDDLGLENVGIATDRGKISVNNFYHTGVADIYAIGDVIPTPALAHMASAEAVACIEHIAEDEGKTDASGKPVKFHPVNYEHIPGATYTTPQIASCGMSERKAKEMGINYKVGKFMFTASGKATAAGKTDGFVKLISDADTDKLLGVHLIGADVTEIIGGMVLALDLGATAEQVKNTVFPHPTMSEAIRDAAEAL
ncbi:MAG: dihydrolipoyl dehydrogenase [Bacteroidales bacterium]|nr:dihydrolipoyl dehydrogenase [Bacteroidales bacterium]